MKKEKQDLFTLIKQNKKEIIQKTKSVIDIDNCISYMPEKYNDDNILTQIIKEEIINRGGIIFRDLYNENKFDSEQQMSNFKAGLNKNKIMSIDRFDSWMIILEKNWAILHGKILTKYNLYKQGYTYIDIQKKVKKMYPKIEKNYHAWYPIIYEKDSYLMKIVKKEINSAGGINLQKKLRAGKFESSGQMNNFKSSLKYNRNMSFEYFIKSLEIIDVDWLLITGETLDNYVK